jgi:glycosyltransferase involved in cell wall biosynthesis/protein-tyrosine-phosphatase
MTPLPRQPLLNPQPVPTPERLRVCQIMSADLWAGAEVQVATAASYLAARTDVTLTAIVFNDGWLASELRRLGIAVSVVDEQRHSALRMVHIITRLLRAQDVDVVHTHRQKDNVIGSIAAKLAGVRHVIRTVHGLPEPMRGWSRTRYRVNDALDRAMLWCFADRVVAVSRHGAAALARSGYPRRSIVQIHNGIDLERVRASRTRAEVRLMLGIADDELVVGTAGRLTPVKGQQFLVEAARLVLREEPKARFVFVGSGPLKRALVAQAASLGVDRACLFVDPLTDPNAAVFDLMAAFDTFVLPSLSEGIPMALLEAMALSRPVVAAAVGGVPEVVQADETGLLVQPQNAQALARACLELARNRPWAEGLGASARRAVEAEFSHDKNGRALLDLYREVVRIGRHRTVGPGALLQAPVRKVFGYIRRKIRYAIEWHRVSRMRRNPSQLTAMLQSATRILVVCHGNIIRSPFAARLIAQAVGNRRSLSIVSAGLEAEAGRPPHPTAVLTATPLRVDLSDHTASRIAPDTVANADAIFVMDVQQLLTMRRRYPGARHKTLLLTCLAADTPLEVRDPVDGEAPMFRACYEHISLAVRPIVHTLSGGTP